MCSTGQLSFHPANLDTCLAQGNLSIADIYGFNPLNPLGMMRIELCLLHGTSFGACFINISHINCYTPMRTVVRIKFSSSCILDEELTCFDTSNTYSLRNIPKINNQAWFGDIKVLGPVKNLLMEGCKAMHKAAGWQYVLWTDESMLYLPEHIKKF